MQKSVLNAFIYFYLNINLAKCSQHYKFTQKYKQFKANTYTIIHNEWIQTLYTGWYEFNLTYYNFNIVYGKHGVSYIFGFNIYSIWVLYLNLTFYFS